MILVLSNKEVSVTLEVALTKREQNVLVVFLLLLIFALLRSC